MQFHLQQLLPAIFTCVVAGRLTMTPSEDHCPLRANAAAVLALACRKFKDIFPDMQVRYMYTVVILLIYYSYIHIICL